MKSKRTRTLLFERKTTVDLWIKEGIASAKWIDRVEIESVAKTAIA